MWIFLVLFVLSLFAEFIANDKPLLVKYEGNYYFPVLRSYPETAFGGIFETEAVYRDPAVKEMIAAKDGWILWPPIRFSYDTPNKNPPMAFPVKPTWMLTKEDCEAGDQSAAFIPATPSSNGTGSAPTIRAATSSPA